MKWEKHEMYFLEIQRKLQERKRIFTRVGVKLYDQKSNVSIVEK